MTKPKVRSIGRLAGSAVLIAFGCLIHGTALAQDKSAPVMLSIIAKGEYLARVGDCIACHTTSDGIPFAGGRAMVTPFGILYTSNITPDDATGIGRWTSDQFYTSMHDGRFPDGGLLYPAMPSVPSRRSRARIAMPSSPFFARQRLSSMPIARMNFIFLTTTVP